MMFTTAITRKPGPNFSHGITTSLLRQPSYELIVQQHDRYVETLRLCGLDVVVLAADLKHPDAYFVEDTAIITKERAIITNPGAPERRGEVVSMEDTLKHYRHISRIKPPGTVDGGDILQVGDHFLIGLSERTNEEGARQLTSILMQDGSSCSTVRVKSGLHLKSSVNSIGDNRLIMTRDYADHPVFSSFDKIVVNKLEEYAANTLWINTILITPAGFPDTLSQLKRSGLDIHLLDISEARKMDGGLTCMSLRF